MSNASFRILLALRRAAARRGVGPADPARPGPERSGPAPARPGPARPLSGHAAHSRSLPAGCRLMAELEKDKAQAVTKAQAKLLLPLLQKLQTSASITAADATKTLTQIEDKILTDKQVTALDDLDLKRQEERRAARQKAGGDGPGRQASAFRGCRAARSAARTGRARTARVRTARASKLDGVALAAGPSIPSSRAVRRTRSRRTSRCCRKSKPHEKSWEPPCVSGRSQLLFAPRQKDHRLAGRRQRAALKAALHTRRLEARAPEQPLHLVAGKVPLLQAEESAAQHPAFAHRIHVVIGGYPLLDLVEPLHQKDVGALAAHDKTSRPRGAGWLVAP